MVGREEVVKRGRKSYGGAVRIPRRTNGENARTDLELLVGSAENEGWESRERGWDSLDQTV